jgi:ArsR family transcriptional regulator
MLMNEEHVVLICKALSDTNRLKIVSYLTKGERCACDILETLQITQPTLSHHMKILTDIQLVTARKDGKWTHYSLNCEILTAFRDYISKLKCTKSNTCHNGRNKK